MPLSGFSGQTRSGSAAHMTDEELKTLIEIISSIAKREKKGTIFVIEEASTPEDEAIGTESSVVTMYGNGIAIDRIHRVFHDSLPVATEKKNPDVKVFKGSVNDLMDMLKRDIDTSKKERGESKE